MCLLWLMVVKMKTCRISAHHSTKMETSYLKHEYTNNKKPQNEHTFVNCDVLNCFSILGKYDFTLSTVAYRLGPGHMT